MKQNNSNRVTGMDKLAIIEQKPLSRDLIKEIAMDIGKETVAYIEVMYPQAIEATSSTFKLSVRNHIYNQIMAALEVNEEGAVIDRLEDRKKWRREWTAIYRKLRKQKPITDTSDEIGK